ncbi:phosphatase PAP2 family protein [Ensifer adhaerens]|uniref:phosphatase PAP2 family protein n=1 Tax=Ensifer adhaerens TaxID=106592 RepID=UPI001CBC7801|nr:phosphatase PAP2 family protein [Ensifer adhaerens]MBZ7923452.1 phosphatase PAP2 family protein [Ensifer adhaerens]UAX92015.1 phosphatase PAP2 family protein [Ensifer adhaerens]UAX99647.1 phosphatase PAP2 family protein [Ensifer adhaerens]UAY07031.1 phosphatase PAP2 family protein [Ensifer adhaerens]
MIELPVEPSIAGIGKEWFYVDMGANRRLVSIIVAVTLLFAVIDVVWLPISTISLDPRNFGRLAKAASAALAAYLIGRLVLYRLRDESSWAARAMRWAADSLIVLAAVSMIFLPLGFVSAIFMYIASATQVPLVDGNLAALDAALGFDWRSFLETTNGSPPVAWALVIAYHSLAPQVIGLFLLYSAVRRADKALEFVALLAVSSVFTGLLMAMFPAAGAYAYFDPAPETFDAFTAQAGMWHYSELLRLRSGESFNLFVANAQGLVTFPSYHTAVGIMIIYSLRSLRWVAAPIAVLNAVMIVGTLPEGGHHLSDVVAGAIVAVVSILVVRAVMAMGQERYQSEQAATAR